MTGDPGKEHGTNKPPPPQEFRRGQKETPRVLPPARSFLLTSILSEQCVSHQEGLWVWRSAKDNPETNPITIKLWDFETSGRAVPTLSNKISCFVNTNCLCVSLNNSFLSVRQEPTLEPWKGSPFLQQNFWRRARGQAEEKTGLKPVPQVMDSPLHTPPIPESVCPISTFQTVP